MATPQIGLRDVRQGAPASRARLLAPLRYLVIRGPEKAFYDLWLPSITGLALWLGYLALEPKPSLFGPEGLLRFTRDMLIMAVPFMVGALAGVAMGLPGPHLDRRPAGADLLLDGRSLNLRQFVCYLLGYLCFLGLLTLVLSVGASLVRDAVLHALVNAPDLKRHVLRLGALGLLMMLSFLSVTVLWALYFLTDIVNREAK